MKTELYTITTLTNMQVGSGEINFDIIDKQVQRDATSKLPVIHSSSLKGAFRESFAKYNYTISDEDEVKIEKKPDSNIVKYIFGPENSDDSSHQTGAYIFYEARLLTRPVRSNKKSHFLATSPAVLKELLNMIEAFDIKIDDKLKTNLKELSNLPVKKDSPLIFEDLGENTILEDFTAVYHNFKKNEKLKNFLGENLALFEDNDFKELDLPVLARNHLENGESKNLWYEEAIPKESKFYFFISKPTNLDDSDKKEKLDNFDKQFEEKIKKVQIGANKSIGYGFCEIKRIENE